MAENWSHFDFESGANPYIAKTVQERNYIIAYYRSEGVRVEEIEPAIETDIRFYIVKDRSPYERLR